MAYFLRKVDYAHQTIWEGNWGDEYPWLIMPGLPSDLLGNEAVRTDNCELSVYFINEDKSNINRVMAALNAKREFLTDTGYLLFEESLPSDIGIKVQQTDGETYDDHLNKNWHYDLVELNADAIVNLCEALVERCEIESLFKDDVIKLIGQSMSNKYLRKVSKGIRKELPRN